VYTDAGPRRLNAQPAGRDFIGDRLEFRCGSYDECTLVVVYGVWLMAVSWPVAFANK
jgi:hypothetical protein